MEETIAQELKPVEFSDIEVKDFLVRAPIDKSLLDDPLMYRLAYVDAKDRETILLAFEDHRELKSKEGFNKEQFYKYELFKKSKKELADHIRSLSKALKNMKKRKILIFN